MASDSAATDQLELLPRCPNCHGKGKNRFGICAYCNGTGHATSRRKSSQLAELPGESWADIFKGAA